MNFEDESVIGGCTLPWLGCIFLSLICFRLWLKSRRIVKPLPPLPPPKPEHLKLLNPTFKLRQLEEDLSEESTPNLEDLKDTPNQKPNDLVQKPNDLVQQDSSRPDFIQEKVIQVQKFFSSLTNKTNV